MPGSDEQATQNIGAAVKPPQQLVLTGDKVTTWKIFKKRWTNYALLTNLSTKPREYQVALLENCLGDDAVTLYEGFSFTTEDSERTTKEIIQAFDDFVKGDVSETFERYTFNNRKQEEGETFNDYYSRLRVLIKSCNYCATCQPSILRDRIVLGITCNETRQELLKIKDLNLEKCTNICRAAETASGHSTVLNAAQLNRVTKSTTTNHKQQTRPTGDRGDNRQQQAVCGYCGYKHPKGRDRCAAYGKTCNKCGKLDHFASVCQNNRNSSHDSVKGITYDQDSLNNDRGNQYESADQTPSVVSSLMHRQEENGAQSEEYKWVYAMTAPGADAKARMLINGASVVFQLDTGSAVNTIPRSKVPSKTIIEQTGRLEMWNNSTFQPAGQCTLEVINPRNGMTHRARFIVFDQELQPLLGLRTCQEMELVTIHCENIQKVMSIWPTQFPQVFDEELGTLPGPPHHLVTKPEIRPCIMADRRIPIAVRPKLKQELERLARRGVITPVDEPTPWCSQLAFDHKPNGDLRICIDPHELNKALCREHYTLPILEDVLHELRKSTVFSKADLSSGYWHVELDHESSMLTTFQTCFGRYRWCRLPFGTNVSSEVFQRRLITALDGLKGIVCVADDIIIHGKNQQEHDENMDKFLQRCKTTGIKLNKTKLHVGLREVTFMGHRITDKGLCVDPEKVNAITKMTTPKDIHEVRRFIGMTNYLARFIPNVAERMQPLLNLLQKDVQFQWTSSQQEAFEEIKQAITKTPVLAFYDPEEPLTLENDSSEYGLGSVIMQKGKPVAFASRTLTPTERRYAQIEKEMLSVVFGLVKFHHYTYGRKVDVVTDHKPLVAIKNKPLSKAPSRLQAMLLKAQKYNYTLTYKPGTEIPVADTLSRAPLPDMPAIDLHVDNVTITKIDLNKLDRIRQATKSDPVLQELARTIMEGWPETRGATPTSILPFHGYRDELTTQDGIIF